MIELNRKPDVTLGLAYDYLAMVRDWGKSHKVTLSCKRALMERMAKNPDRALVLVDKVIVYLPNICRPGVKVYAR